MTRATVSAVSASFACAYASLRKRAHAGGATRDRLLELVGGQQLIDDAEPDGLARGIERGTEQ